MADWRERFMGLARWWADECSKDPQPGDRCGAVIVRGRRVIATGYNGPTPGVDDADSSKWVPDSEGGEKLLWCEHAERNAVYHCARYGVAAEGAVMYATKYPCEGCARAVVQAGIAKVVCPPLAAEHRGKRRFAVAAEVLTRGRVEVELLAEGV